MNPAETTLISGATNGAEAEFGRLAEQYGLQEINYSFEGHNNVRSRGLHELSREELLKGDVSLTYVSRLLNRNYTQKGDTFRKVLQTLFHIVNTSEEVFVIGEIQGDQTVKGGTGWGTEFAKICNKPLFTFDQKKGGWFSWQKTDWEPHQNPLITRRHFAGLGTRFLEDSGQQAIAELFKETFGAAK
ncbi:MAG: hypothetical protein OEZ59_13075 [Deltaproteobacteria bacterium]|nr:hypothetical protein [Deltaproteobacteria bacterium]